MANLLTSGLAYNPFFYANEALRVLYKRLGMAFYVKRDLATGKGSGTGDTVQVRRPQVFAAQNMPIAEASFADVSPAYDNLQISEWQGQGFKLTDKEKTLSPQKFIDEHLTPVAAAIADAIDVDLAGLALECPWIVADDATNPYKDFPNIRERFLANLAPVVNPNDYAYQVDGVLQKRYETDQIFVQANTAGDAELQRAGQLGVKYGFRIFPNQNAPTYTGGAVSGATIAVSGAHAKDSATLTLAVGTPSGTTLTRGSVLVVAGHSQKYAVKADVAWSTTVVVQISPKLASALAGSEAVTIEQTTATSIGVAFHRDAIALVMQPLEDAGPGILSATVSDPITGLMLRSRIWGSGGLGATIWALDALWGYKMINPNLAVRLEI